MDKAPNFRAGDVIKRGDIIGRMGTSGQSTAIHLHIDCIDGAQIRPFKLDDITAGKYKSCKKQLDYFIDSELFGVKPFITTQYLDSAYELAFGKKHWGYDVVPIDRHDTTAHYNIHWNRSMVGRVANVVFDPTGYGHCIYIAFEA
jgi:murein DD-endopeptidase MepM/ murein hydrolase activator NlpD